MGWRRMGGPDHVLVSTLLIMVGALWIFASLVTMLIGGWHLWIPALWLVAAAFVAFAGRLLMTGVLVNDTGVRVRTLTRTLFFSWDAILAIRSTRTVVNGYRFFVSFEAREIAFDLTDGQTITAPITGMYPGMSRDIRFPRVMAAAEFDRVLAGLRQVTSEYQTRPVG